MCLDQTHPLTYRWDLHSSFTHLFGDGLVGKDHGAAGKAAAGAGVAEEGDDRQGLGEEAGAHGREGARHLPHHLLGLKRATLTHGAVSSGPLMQQTAQPLATCVYVAVPCLLPTVPPPLAGVLSSI